MKGLAIAIVGGIIIAALGSGFYYYVYVPDLCCSVLSWSSHKDGEKYSIISKVEIKNIGLSTSEKEFVIITSDGPKLELLQPENSNVYITSEYITPTKDTLRIVLNGLNARDSIMLELLIYHNKKWGKNIKPVRCSKED